MDQLSPGEKFRRAESTRTEVTYEELSVDNVPNATTLSLLRERERDLYAQCTRLYRCLNPEFKNQFVFESKEGVGDDAVKVRNLNFAIHLLANRVNELRSEVNSNAAAKKAFKRANRSSGFVRKTWQAISSACVTQLAYRRDEIDDLISSLSKVVPHTSTAQRAAASEVHEVRAGSNSTGMVNTHPVPAVAAANQGKDGTLSRHERHKQNDDRRYHQMLDVEEAGLRKPSVGERLVAARTRAYETGNVMGVRVAEERIAKRRGVRQRARNRKKQRRQEFREWCRTLESNNRIPDPRSDDEGAGVA